MVRVKVLKTIRHDGLGLIQAGEIIEITEGQAEIYARVRAVELYDTKVLNQKPFTEAGEVIPLSVSPAAEVLPVTTPKKSGRGVRKVKLEQ